MKIYELKTLKPYFDQLWNGLKKFEVRENDRDFKLDGLLLLKEYDVIDGYSGKEILARIDYILNDEKYCKENYVIMSITELYRRED